MVEVIDTMVMVDVGWGGFVDVRDLVEMFVLVLVGVLVRDVSEVSSIEE